MTDGPGNAIYFSSGGDPLFGWFHNPPVSALRNLGLVICKPFGYEALCSHRSLRAFAEAAVGLGVPTLNIDYLGSGDSGEIDPQADQLVAWTKDVIAAVHELRRRTGVQTVCLLGVRLGALLAILAARECAAVTSLVLIAPIVSGRRYVREMKTARLAASVTAAAPVGDAGDGSIEVGGFPFSAATLAALAQVDLKAHPAPSVTDMLVIDGKDLPGASAWVAGLAESCIRTKYLVLPGLIEMVMTAPQFAAVPREMIAETQDWLRQLAQAPAAIYAGGMRHLESDTSPPFATITLRDGGIPTPLIERPVFFGSATLLFGIVTEPRPGEIRRRAVILLNAGADNHIGPNRIHVTLARDWASRGYVVMRMDLAGMGDSATRLGKPDDEVFPAAAIEDIRAAVDFMRTRYVAGEVNLVGLCSGAYHALRAATAGLPVNRILMVNPQNYFWKEGMALDDLQLAEVVHNPGVYRQRMFSRKAWMRLIGGHVNLWRITKIYFYRPLLAIESALRDIARWMRIRLPNDLGWELEETCRRGVKMAFVFARGEPGIDLLKLEGGLSVKRIGDSCHIHIIEGADHTFSRSGQRAMMKQILSDELFARK